MAAALFSGLVVSRHDKKFSQNTTPPPRWLARSNAGIAFFRSAHSSLCAAFTSKCALQSRRNSTVSIVSGTSSLKQPGKPAVGTQWYLCLAVLPYRSLSRPSSAAYVSFVFVLRRTDSLSAQATALQHPYYIQFLFFCCSCRASSRCITCRRRRAG